MHPFTAMMIRRADALKNMARSIHRRNWNGTSGKKVNTCRVPGAKAKAIVGLTEHLQRHPNDGQSEAHLAWLKGEAA